MTEKDIILSLDIGTTNIKLAAINKSGDFICINKCPLQMETPHPGYQEICPNKLWTDIESLFKLTVKGIESRIAALGISTHRATFITWERNTVNYLHNFITWADRRAQKMCDDWNNSYLTRIGQTLLYWAGKIVGSNHMMCAAYFKIVPANVQMRFKWVMENVASAKPLHEQGNLCFGTLDTWLIYKLTGKTTWATDYTNAAATGIYDLWNPKWCPVMTWVFSNPLGALPDVLDSNATYGHISPSLNLGFSAPICGVLGDQQASIVGNHLFNEGDVKLSLGTSLSCDRLTASFSHPVAMSVYPQIAWKLAGEDVYYLAESMTMETRGKYLDWLLSANLVDAIEDIDAIARSVQSCDTPFFTKTDSSITDVPIENYMVEKTSGCTNAHFVRAVMEAHAFRSKVLLDDVFDFYGQPSKIIVDGGASSSSFILECISAITGLDVYKSNCVEGALMGAFFMTGLGLGWWKNFEDIKINGELTRISPLQGDQLAFLEKFKKWKQYTDLTH